MGKKNILFLLVNYFNEREVAEFVTSQLGKYLNGDVHIIITDNGSKEPETLKQLAAKYENVTVVKPDKNLGYFGAANFGLSCYLIKNADLPDAVIVCNTDIELVNTDFIGDLNKVMNEKQFDVMGPDIYSTFMKYHQNPYIINRISAGKMKLYKFVTSNTLFYSMFTLLHLIKGKLFKSNIKSKVDKPMDTFAVHGSFMIFNKSYFDKGGILNYPSFLFGEELFVAELGLKLGLKTVYEPLLIVKHFQNSTTGIFKTAKSVKFLHESYSYLLKTFFASEDK